MPVRHRLRKGDYLVRDDITGKIIYASQASRDYNGNLTQTSRIDPIQPQLFVKALDDPQPVSVFSPDTGIPPASLFLDPNVAQTDVPAPFGAATHLFTPNYAIPQMVIGSSFVVR